MSERFMVECEQCEWRGPETDGSGETLTPYERHLLVHETVGSDGLDLQCKECAPFDCDDPDRHLGVDSKYTPLKNRGCICGADFDGRDCMCFEGDGA